ncbi:MAG TPA: dehydrogenase E1 component subunit alpha/beta [Terriglobales bacterium]|nr:dehydrogenase E1 component subunit alpha/beta [Terriglobales bacterium]
MPKAAPVTSVVDQPGIAPERVLELYRVMQLSRRLDDRELVLKRQQKIYFQISGAGHEAITAVAGDLLRPGYDWVYPYYRDRALCLRLGVTPTEMLLEAVGSSDDPASGGRQMPSHWGHAKYNIVSSSSPTGTQYLQAVGCAEAGRYLNRHANVAEWLEKNPHPQTVSRHADEVVLVSSGEGATSEGEFWEALNGACREKLPVIFLIEDNGYAISVPCEVQGAGVSLSRLVENFPNLSVLRCDGCDIFSSHEAMSQALKHCRSGNGPALVHAQVVRPYSHSQSDDERSYRPESERAEDAARDPILRLRKHIVENKLATAKAVEALDAEVEAEVVAAADAALAAPIPGPETIYNFVYSPDVDPASDRFASQPATAADDAKPLTMVDAINTVLHEEMERDPRILIFGEDVADCTREANLGQVKGKGGVFTVTKGLQRAFGADRVYNSPLAEASIVGRAIGIATRGLKPVPEVQFFDYIWPAMMQIRDELSTMRWRSNGAFASPVVLRVAIGGYLTGGAIYHSQCGESIFTHMPGLRVLMPSTAVDACGLLRTALRSEDPVLFLEHKRLYREPFNRGPHPGRDFCIPFGKARVARPGTDLTVVTYGAVVQRAVQAAEKLAHEQGANVEVLDLRSLAPYDWEAVAESVKKTSRVIVAHEDVLSFGYGAEIAARIADELFESLDAPVRRVAAKDVYCGYQPVLEDATLPQASDLYDAIAALLRF